MEEYAKQFTPDPLVKESLTTDSVSAEIAHTEIDWPTDEEIENQFQPTTFTIENNIDNGIAVANMNRRIGAKWMRDHIKSKMK